MTRKPTPAIRDANVKAVFAACPRPVRERLMALRRLIFDTAAATPGVGTVEETLKWGQPSYLTPKTRSGSTIRIDRVKDTPGHVAMYFNCNSKLVPTFVELYPGIFNSDGKRVLFFDEADALFGKRTASQEAPLRHCIALALTHHLRKRRVRP
jgi:Domain of unknown function (DU1801)